MSAYCVMTIPKLEIMESVDYGDTRPALTSSRETVTLTERTRDLVTMDSPRQEFDGEELVDVEEDEEEDSYLDLDESSDDDM